MQIHRLPVAEPSLTSIVILAFNQWQTTKACLDSIFSNTTRPFELIIVDNASSDETPGELDKLAASDPRVTVIHNRSNLGFPGGNNQGIALARGEYVLLLNNDTVVPAGWLERLLAPLEEDAGVGLVGPVTNYSSKWQMIENITGQYTPDTPDTLDEWAGRWAQEHSQERQEVPSLVGFCLLLRRSIVERSGGLDERFGVGNFEDDDICERGKLLGFRCVIAVDCFIHHEGSKSFTAEGLERFSRTLKRNWEIYRQKWQLPAAEYGSPQMRTLADLSRFTPDYGAQPLPALDRDHFRAGTAAGGNVWNQLPDDTLLVARADWRLGGHDDLATAGVCDVLERNGQPVVRLPFTATTLSRSTLIVPASDLTAPGRGCLAAVVCTPSQTTPAKVKELVAKADLVVVADEDDAFELVQAGVPGGLIHTADPPLGDLLTSWCHTNRTPVRELLPAEIDTLGTTILLADPVVEGDARWQNAFTAYLHAAESQAQTTLAIPAPPGEVERVGALLEQAVASAGLAIAEIPDVCLVEHSGSDESLQLACDWILAADPRAARRAPHLDPTAEAISAAVR